MKNIVIKTAGESGLVVELGTEIDEEINSKVRRIAAALSQQAPLGLREVVPTYRSFLVYFDPLLLSRTELIDLIHEIVSSDSGKTSKMSDRKTVYIPVCYSEEFGPDLSFVAEYNSLAVAEVIKLHCERAYLIYMLGFMPGFPYLGGLSRRLFTPRLNQPRLRIPAGSVGIADQQTGFYPAESPGGWRIIGRTPVRPFQPGKESAFLFEAGDYLRFQPISHIEYEEIEKQIQLGTYRPLVVQGTQGGGGNA